MRYNRDTFTRYNHLSYESKIYHSYRSIIRSHCGRDVHVRFAEEGGAY